MRSDRWTDGAGEDEQDVNYGDHVPRDGCAAPEGLAALVDSIRVISLSAVGTCDESFCQ